MAEFDLAVIGAGPGGFDAALRARELGFKVALIDKSDPGGTCLNSGCIPTKSLLASTKLLSQIMRAESYGLPPLRPACDFSALLQRKDGIVETLRKGMLDAIKRSGVEWISGTASFAGKNRLMISGSKAGVKGEIEARWIIIATGSQPVPFPGVPFDRERILSSTDVLKLKTLPKSLLILGGGVVGVEFASIFQPLGVKITIVEMLERLIAAEDEEVSRRLESIFRRKGIEIHTGERVKQICRGAMNRAPTNHIEIILESGQNLEADCVLVAIGRRPSIETLALEKASVQVERGAIQVNEDRETSAAGVFAIGDATNRSSGLAHGASTEGIHVVENLKGPKQKLDFHAIPNCIYTDPEVASAGVVPASEKTIETKVLFSSLGKSHVEGETEGFLKMTASKKDGRILRVSAIGPRVTELIHEAALAVHAGLSVQTVARMVHAHPTQSEIFWKAARVLSSVI